MVEQYAVLDGIFGSLANGTRRDILDRLTRHDVLNMSQIAAPYPVSLAAISKHVRKLEEARLVHRRRAGNDQLVALNARTLKEAADYVNYYETFWARELDAFEAYLRKQGH